MTGVSHALAVEWTALAASTPRHSVGGCGLRVECARSQLCILLHIRIGQACFAVSNCASCLTALPLVLTVAPARACACVVWCVVVGLCAGFSFYSFVNSFARTFIRSFIRSVVAPRTLYQTIRGSIGLPRAHRDLGGTATKVQQHRRYNIHEGMDSMGWRVRPVVLVSANLIN